MESSLAMPMTSAFCPASTGRNCPSFTLKIASQ
jgi:hypothetical protein